MFCLDQSGPAHRPDENPLIETARATKDNHWQGTGDGREPTTNASHDRQMRSLPVRVRPSTEAPIDPANAVLAANWARVVRFIHETL